MKVTHYWQDDSWWDSGPGCDCCPGGWMEAYNRIDEEGNYIGPHSVYSVEECYQESYLHHVYGPYHDRQPLSDLLLDGLDMMDRTELRDLCEGVGLDVIVEEPEFE